LDESIGNINYRNLSLASKMEVIMTDLVVTVGELNSSLSMYPLCLWPLATVLPLISPVHFIKI
jgi:hypothetical protein